MRAADAQSRVTDLTARRNEAQAEVVAHEDAPAQIAGRKAQAIEALEAAEAAHRRAADTLIAAITHSNATDRAARSAESALASARTSARVLIAACSTGPAGSAGTSSRLPESCSGASCGSDSTVRSAW